MDFSGKPPFTYEYTFDGEHFTNTTSSPSVVFTTKKGGTFRVVEYHDYFNYSVTPSSLFREVRFVTPPTYSVKAPPFTCDHTDLEVGVAFDGNGPFNIEYH